MLSLTPHMSGQCFGHLTTGPGLEQPAELSDVPLYTTRNACSAFSRSDASARATADDTLCSRSSMDPRTAAGVS
jgi:hypothetical protein